MPKFYMGKSNSDGGDVCVWGEGGEIRIEYVKSG